MADEYPMDGSHTSMHTGSTRALAVGKEEETQPLPEAEEQPELAVLSVAKAIPLEPPSLSRRATEEVIPPCYPEEGQAFEVIGEAQPQPGNHSRFSIIETQPVVPEEQPLVQGDESAPHERQSLQPGSLLAVPGASASIPPLPPASAPQSSPESSHRSPSSTARSHRGTTRKTDHSTTRKSRFAPPVEEQPQPILDVPAYAPPPDDHTAVISMATSGLATCAVCMNSIAGMRYRCTWCYEYDLCEACQASGSCSQYHRPTHPMEPLVPGAVPSNAPRPPRAIEEVLGKRVVRGVDWCWQDQDGRGPGTVVKPSEQPGWVEVLWDANPHQATSHRWGFAGRIDLLVTEEQQPEVATAAIVVIAPNATPETQQQQAKPEKQVKKVRKTYMIPENHPKFTPLALPRDIEVQLNERGVVIMNERCEAMRSAMLILEFFAIVLAIGAAVAAWFFEAKKNSFNNGSLAVAVIISGSVAFTVGYACYSVSCWRYFTSTGGYVFASVVALLSLSAKVVVIPLISTQAASVIVPFVLCIVGVVLDFVCVLATAGRMRRKFGPEDVPLTPIHTKAAKK
eukprot:m51a1_g8182 putative e3 ubiquitin-protein ligase mib2-like (568) ;mRNA; r:138114-140438